jgi:hypothetical protein
VSEANLFQIHDVYSTAYSPEWQMQNCQVQAERLPASPAKSVLMAWNALLTHQDEEAALALQRASDEQSGFTRSLDAIVQAERTQTGALWATAPFGLAEYHYGLALRAMQASNWTDSLEHFQRALVYHPGPWSESFYESYRQVLTRTEPTVMDAIALEEILPPATLPQVRVGHKNQPGWEAPVPVSDTLELQGFSIRSWTALDYGLPSLVDFFWQDTSGQVVRETVETWNLLPNGGFELGADQNPADVLGWFQSTDRYEKFARPVWRRIWRAGKASTALLSIPSNLGNWDDVKVSRTIRVAPNSNLVWSAWIDNTGEGNPHIFVFWLGEQNDTLSVEVPMQGNARGQGKTYAGLLTVPAQAVYMRVVLQNWKVAGEVLWDDLFLAQLPSLPATFSR